jgi:hypothetical protein
MNPKIASVDWEGPFVNSKRASVNWHPFFYENRISFIEDLEQTNGLYINCKVYVFSSGEEDGTAQKQNNY